ncbi:CRTAC1 family protein [Engelhardtia mirabilis]|uniref:ASPIC and UnbV n=1 Tax=Engelhardtia mirabilis TaxID=2528011 RepID=A0A518BRV9_9BACT|nr:ASPIC and UnbV [Planctomycetes bacterium Pla133]QDV04040.1 ASPIC and UnbV [Planctomycetes bacterium Pla86]
MPPTKTITPARRAIALAVFASLLAAVVVKDRASRSAPVPSKGSIGFRLREVSAEHGLEFQHRVAPVDAQIEHVADHIMAVGAAVSASDYDRDGWVDLYVTNSDFGAPNALFHNRGDGRFEDVAAAAGVADLNLPGRGVSMGSVWGDYDNDGDEDLFIYRFGYLALFRNDGREGGNSGGGGFVEVSREAGLERWMNSNGAIWFDYDRDGYLDLLVLAYYSSKHDLWHLATTKIMHDSGEFATNGERNLLFHNNGDGTFEELGERLGMDSRMWSYAALSADFNRDGWPDVYVANDYGSEELWLNVEGQRFESAEANLGHDSKSGMSVALGNVRNDGRNSVFVTNISSPGYVFHGNNLRESRMDGAGVMVQKARGALVDTGWSWGAQFGDLDRDGFQDLVVVNGFISGDRDRSYWYDSSKLSGGAGGIMADAANWPPIEGRSQSGYERSAVLHNNGDGTFADVAEAVGITDTYDGRAVILADLENRGALDVVVANQKGPLLLYRNEPAGGAWIGFELEGTVSNRSAIGAEAELTFGPNVQRQVVNGGTGFSSQNDRRLFFGLGENDRDLHLTLRWPSGRVQELDGLEAGRYHHLVEPEGD